MYQTLAFSPNHKLELWRYFTYSLLHLNFPHLVINVILQLFIALPLESEVGPLAVISVYIGGIFSGSLAASVSKGYSIMVGASSGIYSLLMSHVAHTFMVSLKCSYKQQCCDNWQHFSTELFVNILQTSPDYRRNCVVNQWHNFHSHPLLEWSRTTNRNSESYCWSYLRHFVRLHFLWNPSNWKQEPNSKMGFVRFLTLLCR